MGQYPVSVFSGDHFSDRSVVAALRKACRISSKHDWKTLTNQSRWPILSGMRIDKSNVFQKCSAHRQFIFKKSAKRLSSMSISSDILKKIKDKCGTTIHVVNQSSYYSNSDALNSEKNDCDEGDPFRWVRCPVYRTKDQYHPTKFSSHTKHNKFSRWWDH